MFILQIIYYSNYILTPYWIFILFLFTLGLTNSVYAEPTDVEIDWIIEGQISTEKPLDNESKV